MSERDERRRTVTSFDVARAAGVSRASVSRAFTADAPISPELRAHVLEVAERIGYSVNQIARGLNRQRSDLVGVIVSRLDNPYRSAQVEALTKAMAAESLRPLLFCIAPDEPVDTTLRLLLDYQVSGVVITSGAPDERIVEESMAKRAPLILVDRPSPPSGIVDHVRGDNRAGGRIVAEALHAAGRRSIIAFRPQRLTYSLNARIESFSETAKDLGLEVAIAPMDGSDYDAGFRAVSKTLAKENLQLDGTEALFMPNDFSALGGLDAARQAGVHVPEQLGLMGYDDIPQAQWANAQLSTVRQDPVAVADAVVALLQRRAGSPEAPSRALSVPVSLQLRTTH